MRSDLFGILSDAEALSFLDLLKKQTPESYIFIVHDERLVELYQQQLRGILPRDHILLALPAFDCIPYDRASPSQAVMSQRVQTLLRLHRAQQQSRQKICLILSIDSFLQRVPPPKALAKHDLTIGLGDTLSRERLLNFFNDTGFKRSETVFEVGDYAVRGSIVDCYPSCMASPVRLDFLGDDVESIRTFDVLTQQSTGEMTELLLTPVSELLLNDTTIEQFRIQFRSFYPMGAPLYQSISRGRTFAGMEHFLPLFYPTMSTILDYVDQPLLVWGLHTQRKREEAFERIHLYYGERSQPSIGERPYYPLPPQALYLSRKDIEVLTAQGIHFHRHDHPDHTGVVKPLIGFEGAKQNGLKSLVDKTKKAALEKAVLIACKSEGTVERARSLFGAEGITLRHLDHLSDLASTATTPTTPLKGIFTLPYPTQTACEAQTFILIPDYFFFGEGKSKKSRQETIERFLSELNTYAPGDFLVHRNHGIGKYIGLETVDVERIKHDCLILEYADANKLFLPVENMDVLTHFAKEGAVVTVDRLGTTAWQQRKSKTKKKLLEVAEYLIKVAAARQLKEGMVFEPKTVDYDTFCKGFPYIETNDQAGAVEDVERDLMSGKPMDRLVCGDVGFGKTEVALRAAFITASVGYQVAVVVPTTLLARQHFASFKNRFKGTGIHVEMLCRLVTAKKASAIRKDVQEGRIHILISTHAAFSERLEFSNLGLLIIDEEHHFGVKQKEKLKTIREDIHVLTLTATPIPRTLQMSLAGIREMSLITTPPVDRLPVRTFVLEQDFTILRDVMMREYKRGGQTFFVSPRLEDLEKLKGKIESIVPELRVTVAHGQLSTAELEDRVQDFYDHTYDVLLSTNIIESGIDIPNANTMIVHKAHLFGLAQLYQMRGRIGRAKKQAYAYLTVPVDTCLTQAAHKRLKVLQSLDQLGAGFTLASHDMDIRGSGNLLGEEQSGHIREVGLELYQHMLQDAIFSLRAREPHQDVGIVEDFMPTLNLGIPVLIPETYVSDLSLRLGLYKRLGSFKEREQVEAFAVELIDRFGPLPREVSNLLKVIELKYFCYQARIEKIDAGTKGIVVQFYRNTFPEPQKLLEYIQHNPKLMKIRPDQKLVLIAELESLSKRLEITTKLCSALARLAA